MRAALLSVCVVLVLATAACSSSGGGGELGLEWCTGMRQIEELETEFELDEDQSSEQTGAYFRQAGDLFRRAVASAPGDIKDDAQMVLTWFDRYTDEMENADWDFENLSEDTTIFQEDPELDAASDRMDAYNESECGISAD